MTASLQLMTELAEAASLLCLCHGAGPAARPRTPSPSSSGLPSGGGRADRDLLRAASSSVESAAADRTYTAPLCNAFRREARARPMPPPPRDARRCLRCRSTTPAVVVPDCDGRPRSAGEVAAAVPSGGPLFASSRSSCRVSDRSCDQSSTPRASLASFSADG